MNLFCRLGFHKWEHRDHERECKKCGVYQSFEIVEGVQKTWVACNRQNKWEWRNRIGPHDFSQCDKMIQALSRSVPMCEECGDRPAEAFAHHGDHGTSYVCSNCIGPDYSSVRFFNEPNTR